MELLAGGELINRGGVVGLAGAENRVGEIGLIRGVGIVLRLEAESRAMLVGHAAFTDPHDFVLFEEVTAVELDAGFGGLHGHDAAGGGFVGFCGEGHFAVGFVEHPIVVVAATETDLFVVGGVAFADGAGRSEVHRRAGDRSDLTSRDEADRDWGIVIGVEGEEVTVDVADTFTLQVEIHVVGEVHGCRLVSGGVVVNRELVIVREQVGDFHFEGAGITLINVGAGMPKRNAGIVTPDDRSGFPHDFIETLVAAVEVSVDVFVRVVDDEGVVGAVEGERAVGDAIAVTTDEATEVRRLVFVVGDVVEAEVDVGELAVTVWRYEADDRSAVGHDVGGEPVAIGEGVELDGFAGLSLAEGRNGDGGLGGCSGNGGNCQAKHGEAG